MRVKEALALVRDFLGSVDFFTESNWEDQDVMERHVDAWETIEKAALSQKTRTRKSRSAP